MDRVIKFRGKYICDGEWLYGYYAVLAGAKNTYFIATSEGVTKQVRPETVGQCTGLKDVNGREIYEGDIVLAWIDIGPGGEKQVKLKVEIGPFGINLESWNWKEPDRLPEIIGNIYENPALVEEIG